MGGLLGFAFVCFSLVLTNFQGTGPAPFPQRIVFAVLTIACVVLAMQVVRLKVVLDGEHVWIHNYWHTYQVPLEDIERVDEPPPYSTFRPRNNGILIHVRDGRIISASAYTRTQWENSDADTVVDALRVAVRHTSTVGDRPPGIV